MKTLLLCLITVISTVIRAQNYIGLQKDSLAVLMKLNENSFRIDNSTVNKVFNYVKYVDRINEQTWLFFLDDNDVCTHHKLMSDYLNYYDMIDKLNKNYNILKDKTWFYTDNNKTYTINLIEEEWYFTIVTKEKID